MQRFPALRTTFIRREVEALRKLGVPLQVVSMRPVDQNDVGAEPEALAHVAATLYLPTNPLSPVSIWANLLAFLHSPRQAWRNLLLAFDNPGAKGFKPRVRLALQVWRGAVLARALRKRGQCNRIHAQFADGAATTALAAARLLGVPFSFTSHTSHQSPALRTKLCEADFVASISQYDRARLLGVNPTVNPAKIEIIHCGLPLEQWPFTPKTLFNDPPVILGVGALIETKGFDILVHAVKILRDRQFSVRCRIVGEGFMRSMLKQLIAHHRLEDHVILLGALPQDSVRLELRNCDLFALPCRVASNGDTEGLPVSLMEAMALGRVAVSCDMTGVPDLIAHGKTGFLASQGDAESLANVLREALDAGESTAQLVCRARSHIEDQFCAPSEAAKLAGLFRTTWRNGNIN